MDKQILSATYLRFIPAVLVAESSKADMTNFLFTTILCIAEFGCCVYNLK